MAIMEDFPFAELLMDQPALFSEDTLSMTNSTTTSATDATDPINSSEKPTFMTIPPELTDLIASFLPQRSLPTFALLNSQCRAISIRYMYASVHLNGAQFGIKPKDPNTNAELPPANTPVPELLTTTTITGCRMLRRVLANPNGDHIAAIREFKMQGNPSTSLRKYYLALVEHIWKNAPALRTIDHYYYPDLPSPCWPDSLRHIDAVHICWWSLKALALPSTRSLRMTNCSWRPGPLKTPFEHVTELEFPWHDWKEELETFNFDWVPEKFPNLRKLSIVTCKCWVDQNIPQKVYRGAFTKVVSALPLLESFTLGERNDSLMETEEEIVYALSQAQPNLKEIKFRWHTTLNSPIVSIIPPEAKCEVTWRRYSSNSSNNLNGSYGATGLSICNGSDIGRPSTPLNSLVPRATKRGNKSDSIDRNLLLWTPDPSSLRSLLWWFTRIGIPDISRPLMMQRWQGSGGYEGDAVNVPSMRVLYEQLFEIVKMEVMKKDPCELDAKGVCECPLCRL